LGREISEDEIDLFLKDSSKIETYLNNGKSEIRWKGKKINHFKLLDEISAETDYLRQKISEVIAKYNKEQIQQIIENIDICVPSAFEKIKLTLQRKKLILRFIEMRVNQLKNNFKI
jgi:hypothetical protein